MATQKTLNKKFSVDGNTVVINEVVEKTLTREELQNEKNMYQQRQNQIYQQVDMLSKQYDEFQTAIEELDSMIKQLPALEKPSLQVK